MDKVEIAGEDKNSKLLLSINITTQLLLSDISSSLSSKALVITTNSNRFTSKLYTHLEGKRDIEIDRRVEIKDSIYIKNLESANLDLSPEEFESQIRKIISFAQSNNVKLILFDELDLFPGIVHYKGNEDFLGREKNLDYLHDLLDEFLEKGKFCLFTNSTYTQKAGEEGFLTSKLGNTHLERVQSRFYFQKQMGKIYWFIKEKHYWSDKSEASKVKVVVESDYLS